MALFHFVQLLAAVTLASGKPIYLPRQAQEASQVDVRPSFDFDINLELLGNTTVKAQVTNVGTEGVRLVQRGGVLDQAPTKKVIVKGGETNPTFTGVRVEYILSHLTEEGFVQLTPDQTVASIFDIADLYALSPDQEYTAMADGILEYTTLTDNTKFALFDYVSNEITFTAPHDVESKLDARSTLVCDDDEYNARVQEAIATAAKMATAAAADARTGNSALFEKFFKSTSSDDIEEVAGRLEAIAKEATTTGRLTYYCEPTPEDYCSANVAAMMYPTLDKVVNCPGYYTSTRETTACGYLDQAGITLHEYAHAESLYPPGTEDIVYGYEGVLSLNTERAKNNADSFAYYASAVYLQCAADDSIQYGTPLDIDLEASGEVSVSTETGSETDGETGIDTTIWDNTDDDSNTDTDTDTDANTETGIDTTIWDNTDESDNNDNTDTTNPATPTDYPEPETPTWTPEPVPDINAGSDSGSGWGWWGNNHGQDDDTTTTTTTGSNTGSGSGWGPWSGGYWGNGNGHGDSNANTNTNTAASDPAASGSPAPVTTTSGHDLYNLNDLIEWLWAEYARAPAGGSTSASGGQGYAASS
ncbi:Deuterolysin metalloprotease family-domain-containing protein [Aspergillus karnatakaensis]|uniref:Deuterolysin metalloprotease family-domain-containing protein n=1 Tax=Aspergillus karnatakaensis TaxID=1810916 RepID=UPI003CCD4289